MTAEGESSTDFIRAVTRAKAAAANAMCSPIDLTKESPLDGIAPLTFAFACRQTWLWTSVVQKWMCAHIIHRSMPSG